MYFLVLSVCVCVCVTHSSCLLLTKGGYNQCGIKLNMYSLVLNFSVCVCVCVCVTAVVFYSLKVAISNAASKKYVFSHSKFLGLFMSVSFLYECGLCINIIGK